VGLRLFLSSTVVDLAAFRDVVRHVCQRLGIEVLAMEEFGPDPRSAVALCREKVERADLFLGLYAHRYGCTLDGFGGASITQLEYKWALARRPAPPVLLFLVDEEQPWPPKWVDHGLEWDRLQAFKKQVRTDHVVGTLTTPDALRDDLFVHLPKFRDQLVTDSAAPVTALPQAPEPYVAHQYTLLQTAQVIGRERELAALDGWVRDPDSPFAAARLLCVVAIGGLGKSALTWKWFHERTPQAMTPLAGRLWWSFYEADAGFDRFITVALAYCGGRSPESVRSLSPLDREIQLLALLDQQPFLLVLDGLERVLIAYANLDFAHLNDEDLDLRTANAVAGAVGRHRLRKSIDPRVGRFLTKLTRVRASRVLVTTRLYPSELQTDTAQELPGSAAWFLRGLQPEDALALWRAMGVSGSDAELGQLFARIDHYPLLIRALAGEVAGYRGAPGDFDRWRREHPDFDPFALPLVQARSHVLAHALGGLIDETRNLLHTITAFRSPVGYDTLTALFVQRRGWAPRQLDSVLTDLEDRGLLGWDRAVNRYDLHPVVRGVVWSGLDDIHRQAVYGTLEQHFSPIPMTSECAKTVEEALPLIELFNALVGLDRYADAAKLFFARLGDFDFVDAGMVHVRVALCESLFPNGLDRPPAVQPRSVHNVYAQLGHCYMVVGRLTEAYSYAIRALDSKPAWGGRLYRHVAERALALGRLCEALDKAELAVTAEGSYYDVRCLALCEAATGRSPQALHRLSEHSRKYCYNSWELEAQISLWQDDFERAAALAQDILPKFSHFLSERFNLTLVLAEARMNLGRIEEAVAMLMGVLREAREKAIVEPELMSLRCLADAHRRLGNHAQARVFLDDLAEPAARGPYRLVQADAANVLALLERDSGNHEAAVAAATAAYRYAWCDGPPLAYHWALQRAARTLQELGVPPPPLRPESAPH
jgi:tetratricopeptide (TPR) repeat protein